MSISRFAKFLSVATSACGLISLSQIISIEPASAFSVSFSNGGFEDSIGGGLQNSWNTIGDVQSRGDLDVVSPTNGSFQAAITTGHTPGDASGFDRDDDNGLNFNLSGNEPVSADTNPDADILQEHIGLHTDAFSIDRTVGSIFPGPRTSKEGSGMFQDFSVTLDPGETSFSVSFDWAFLSNDGTTNLGGNQDFAFWSFGQYDSASGIYTTAFDSADTGDTPNNEIIVLRDSNTDPDFIENITPTSSFNDYLYEFDYDDPNNSTYTYTVSGLTPGQTYNYRLGYGVVDVDGLDRTSTLLLDDIAIQAVPFDFSATSGLGLVGLVFGFSRLRRKLQENID